jgi:hypothetical protein
MVADQECFVLAADGWSGARGQPTTVFQPASMRRNPKRVDHLWALDVDAILNEDWGIKVGLEE